MYQRYMGVVNTFVNSEARDVNKPPVNSATTDTKVGGNGRVRTSDLALMKRPLCR